MKPIIRWTLWERKWSTFWWSIGIGLYIFLVVLVYISLKHQTAELTKAVANFPDTAKALFTDTDSFFTPVGYLDSQVFYLMVPLLFSMLTIGLGSSLVSREEQSGTLEHLLARPVSRSRLLGAKLLAGLGVLVIAGAVSVVATISSVRLAGMDISVWRTALLVPLSLILSLVFGAAAFLLSSIGRLGRGMSIAVAALIGLASYITASLSAQVTWLRWPAKLLPFHYYQPAAVLNGTYNWWNAVILVAASAVLLALSFVAFRRRDIG